MINNIKKIIKTKNLKTKDLINKVGISKSYFYDVINGNSTPTLKIARKISDAMESSLDEVFPNKKGDELIE
ncbi:helix-turn-helix transcriptional regulator [Clostridium tyrobutyricum]|uniref:helix-turn-helix transcriptional regulator n=1 Tax=Clostridium tyrobutyricum TaxID=1519 RepID=UPI001C382A66|nr:helix-turn-helix transcriptional regulator [Clostridium tyrobutyricum]MBV4429401.1 helix-turn-helix domain-containing protein [Clostridium tyrobutyricum]MBV4443028.1 helix-turn-helix domain-containing protein [Clostridium tyrobutyricum]